MEQVASSPCPVFVTSLPHKETEWGSLGAAGALLVGELQRRNISGTLHATSFDRLGAIAKNGIEVVPTDSPIYVANSPSEALKYGGAAKVVLILDPTALDKTYREVPANLPREELEALQQLFPSAMPSGDGEMLWLTRLPEGDTRRSLPYEVDYARWIPGDPFSALRAVLVIGLESADLRDETVAVLRDCTSPNWS